MHEDIPKGRDGAEGGYYKRGMMQEDVINGRDDARGQYKREGLCTRRTV